MLRKLLFCMSAGSIFFSFNTRAQAPGGVPVAAWYKADAINGLFSDAGSTPAANNTVVHQWNESQATGYNLLQATAGYRPVFSNATTLANFNPTVTFDGSNDWMQYTAGVGVNVINRTSGSIYAAGYVNTLKRNGFIGFHASMDYPGLHVFHDYKFLFFTGGPGYQGISSQVMTANSFFSAGTGWQNGAGASAGYAAASVSLNGTRVDYNGSQLNNANLDVNARNLRIGGDNNYGSFSGQLNEMLVFEDKLTAAQMDQVESYLALKYGTTYANGTRNYKSSTGSTVWASTTNAGYTSNIAGITRDDNSALHQKQSWSTNPGQQVLISTTGLANTNAANGTALTNGQYLIWGDNGLAKTPTVLITGIANISHRLASIWKVQNTGAVGSVRVAWPKLYPNQVLIQSTDATIESTDVVNTMGGTQTVNGVEYAYVDVVLTDGQYFTIGVKAVAPGGITDGLRVWLRSDVGFTPAQWQDRSGNLNHFTQTNNTRKPFIASQSFNFNPIVDFGTTGTDARFMAIPAGKPYTANGTNSTMFTAVLSKTAGGYTDIVGFGNTTTGSAVIQANSPAFTKLAGNVVIYPYITAPALPAVSLNKLYLNDVSFTVGTSGIKYGQNGQIATTAQTATASSILHADGGILGAQGEVRNGFIGEFIAYQRDLLEAEKQRVRSYVAIKYGMTLPHNYIASNGTTEFWNVTTNTGYNNNIAGIARDDDGGLYQKQSKSIEATSNVLVGLGPLADANAANAGTLINGQSLLWGDNGLSKTLSTPFAVAAGLNLRFAAIWKVQNTAAVGTVRVAWPATITNLTLVQSTDATFDVSDTRTDMTVNTQVVNGVAYNYANVTLANGQFFTFAGYIAGPAGVATDLSLWYRADNGVETDANKLVTEWSNSTANAVTLTPNAAPALRYNDQTTYTSTWNFNPTVTFTGATNNLRNTTTNYLTSAGSVHYITVARDPNRSTAIRTMFSIAANDDGFYYSGLGGNTALPVIGNGYNQAAAAIATPYNYGIYSAILPKSANMRGFYNGKMKSYGASYGGTYSLPTSGAHMGADVNDEYFNGDIAEVILYHSTTGGDMLNADLAKIHSYLALKYGITLDQATAQNYINSAGSVIWDAVTTNTGYNNHIAGIGRDNTGSLNQKQSRSVNAGSQVLISTTGLANSNATNTSALTNEQFLIWGDNGLAKAPTVAIAGISGVSSRFAAIWKVQNTNSVGTVRVAWPKGFANLKLIQSSDATIDASDVITDMANVQTVAGVEYAYADVTMSNGQYFTFAAIGQAPGGVSNGLSHWYRADMFAVSEGDGTDLTSLTDITSGVTIAQLGEAALPKYKTGDLSYFNFNPGINFTASAQGMGNTNVQTVSGLNYDIFTLTKEGLTAGGNGRIFSSLVNNANLSGSINYWDGIGIMADNRVERLTNTYASRYLANPGNINWAPTHPSIMYNTFTDLAVSKGLNGAPRGSDGTHTARGLFNGGHAIGSTQFAGNGSDNAGFTGHVGELIIYGNGSITAAERNKVDAYLAIKYGITLHNSNNYTTSQNVVVWDAAANSSYYNNVAGIGYDLVSALHQKQSRSQHTFSNNQVIIGLGDIAETNAANPNSLSDGQFLLWGDNALPQAMTNTVGTFTTFSYAGGVNNARRMNRVWKVQNTGVSSEVKIRFPMASVGTTTLPSGEACASYAIVYASDAAFTMDVTALPLVVAEDGVNYDAPQHRFPNGASFFTFARVTPLSNGLVYLPAVVEQTTSYNTNCNVGEWSHYTNMLNTTLKLFGVAGFTVTEKDNFVVTVTPEGTSFENGVINSRLMPRIVTVLNNNVPALATGKVRVYYSADELAATQVPGAITNGWFKYEGDADAVLADIYGDGVFTPATAMELIPAASGVEDGVNYVEFHNITSFSSFVYLSSTKTLSEVLPVNLLKFTVKGQQGSIVLDWTTASEYNNKGFEIERSADARNWTRIDFVGSRAVGGNSNWQLLYSYTDAAPLNGNNYYRLKQVDLDGQHIYSQVKHAVARKATVSVTLTPNPVRHELKVKGLSGKSMITVSNAFGQIMIKVSTQNIYERIIDMSRYTPGVYFIRVENEDGEIMSHKVIKE